MVQKNMKYNRVINYEKKFNVTKLTNILKLMVSPKIKPKM